MDDLLSRGYTARRNRRQGPTHSNVAVISPLADAADDLDARIGHRFAGVHRLHEDVLRAVGLS